MKNEFVYNAGNLLKRVRAGKSIFLPEYFRDSDGEWIERQVEIKSEQEFNAFVSRNQYLKDFLESKNSTVASKIYANAYYVLTSPANSTIAGKLLSGKEFNSSKFYRSGNIPQAKDVIYGAINTFTRDALGIIGQEVELPKVKRTSSQIMKLIKKGADGFYVPEIDKDGLVVTAGLGREHFDCNFVAVNAKDVTEEQLREYLKAPFGDKADEAKVDYDKIIELCKTAYKGMAASDGMFPDVREIMHECLKSYPLSFARIQDKKPEPVPPVPPIPPVPPVPPVPPDPIPPVPPVPPVPPDPIPPVPPVPPVPPDPIPPVPPVPPEPPKQKYFGLRPIRNSRVGIVETDEKGSKKLRNGSSTSVQEVYEYEK